MEHPKPTIERIYLTKADLLEEENDARYWRHIERYISVRHRVYGNVLDLACGVGYGSYIMSKNPDVTKVYGVDRSEETIQFACSEYTSDKTEFFNDISNVKAPIDVMVSIETVEHIQDTEFLPTIAKSLAIPRIIISFPHIKSTHFNKFHFHDFNIQDLKNMFKEWLLIDEHKIHHDVTILEFVANPQFWKMSL